MAVVQLKLDAKGRTYSTIANITTSPTQSTQSTQPQSNVKQSNNQLASNKYKKDQQNNNTCNQIGHNADGINAMLIRVPTVASLNKSRSATVTHSCKKPSIKNGTGKMCLCELEFRVDYRKRSESIKVDNWEYIYKEKQQPNCEKILDEANEEKENSLPR